MSVNVTCADLTCGVEFGIPEHIERQARRDSNRLVHCPNGHRFYYFDSEPEKLRKKISELESKVSWLTSQRDSRDTSIRYLRGQVTRWMNRAKAKR